MAQSVSSYLFYYGLKAGFPYDLLRELSGAWDAARHLPDYVRRKLAARQGAHPAPLVVPPEEGFATFRPGQFRALDQLVPIARAIYERNQEVNETARADIGKSPITHLFNEASQAEVRRIVELATDPEIAAVMYRYFGSVPRFDNADIWVSRPNAKAVGSQLFHLDKPDRRYTSIFLNILDVGPKSGPLTLLGASDSRRVRAATAYDSLYYHSDGRLPDSRITPLVAPERFVQLTGPAGAGGIVDTSECLHCGSRVDEGVRVVMILSYMHAHKPGNRRFAAYANEIGAEDELRRLLLG